MEPFNYIIIAAIGLLFTLQGYGIICFAREPDASETQKAEKWHKAQAFYRWGGPVMCACGLLLWLL